MGAGREVWVEIRAGTGAHPSLGLSPPLAGVFLVVLLSEAHGRMAR